MINQFVLKMQKILSVTGVNVYFKQFMAEPIKAVDDVSFDVFQRDNFGIIGETGSGKTTISNLITGLFGPWGRRGEVKFIYNGRLTKVAKIPSRYLRSHLQVAFQDSGLALNPRLKIAKNLEEVYAINFKKIDFIANIKLLIAELGLSESILDKFPSTLSGGMKRRVFLARAFAALGYLPKQHQKNLQHKSSTEPKLLILDEITLGLDVPLQNKILNFLQKVQNYLNLTYMVISHDLNIVSLLCRSLIVLHRGRLVEEMDRDCICDTSKVLHPYTRLLLDSYHGVDITTKRSKITKDLLYSGCRSRDLCLTPLSLCSCDSPELFTACDADSLNTSIIHRVACHKHKDKI